MDRAEAIRALTVERSSHSNGGLVEQAIDVALGSLREQRERKWISVSERLPKDGNARVLVHLIHSVPQCGKPEIDTDRYLNGMWVRWNGRVTHWMPLPEPPTEGGQEK